MRTLYRILLAGVLVLLPGKQGLAQETLPDRAPEVSSGFETPLELPPLMTEATPSPPATPSPVPSAPVAPIAPPTSHPETPPPPPAGETTPASTPAPPSLGAKLAELEQQLEELRAGQTLQPVAAQEGGKVEKQLELQRKQIETLEKMIRLLADQLKQAPAGGPAVEKLQAQTASLEARSRQAAQRDVELATAIDAVNEHQDAVERYGPALPAPLKELFLPSGNSETILSIYGALAVGYSHILGNAATAANGAGRPPTPGGFYFGEFTPDFLLKLNDWILLEAEIGIGSNGSVSAGSFAQADFFVNDWLTIIAGRFVTPIGFYNERLNNPWINKLPGDAPGSGPLLWQQVLPPLSGLGVQAAGAFYLGCTPFKLEYNAYISNPMNLAPATPGMPTQSEVANLENFTNTFSIVSNDLLYGGRLGLWWPEKGLEAGISGLINGDYVAGGFEDSLALYALDLNYHKGNWDFRAEYGMTYQEAASFGFPNIRRQGFYVQGAYRPRDADNWYLRNFEFVYRYAYIDIRGVDATLLDLTTFGTPVDVPVRRQQNEIGINYWFAPRCVLKVAYQINDEPGFHLHDNQFLTELAWGW